MLKTLYRIILLFLSKIIKTDEVADKFPVSLKIIIRDDDRFLFLKNERDEWDLPGGKINYKEPIEICIKREVLEETKLAIREIELVDFFKTDFNGVEVCIVLYTAEILSKNAVNISFEHNDFNFFNFQEIERINCQEQYKKIISSLT